MVLPQAATFWTMIDETQTTTAIDLTTKAPRGEVLGFCGEPVIVERLKELGIHQGVKIEVCGWAPFGGPRLFRLGATVIALRREEADCIRIQIS